MMERDKKQTNEKTLAIFMGPDKNTSEFQFSYTYAYNTGFAVIDIELVNGL